ncbi:MAG: hypothetical protein L3K23_00495 [Thermoplasmata archaeon]|nr:hypothetical protein [Thermoplasmata archaeon]
MARGKVVEWLLGDDQPSVQYLTLTQLLGRRPSDSDVRKARAKIPTAGWAAEILARRDPSGWWASGNNLYVPKYTSTNWNLLALSDLGASRAVPAVRASCELWMARSPLRGGGVGGNSNGQGHHCFTGNMARALIRFGYGDDPRVRKAMEWLVRTAHPKGGWTCWAFGDGPSPGRTLDSWEGLSAFAAYPRSKWDNAMKSCVERAAEYYLDRELHRQGERYAPWYRFHWPVHYYYDLLVGLDVLTGLGYADDPRLRFALDQLRKRERTDGRWNLDAAHPDVVGKMAEWYDRHPKRRPTPLAFEPVGRPSKMITLRALIVLSRVG